jgi:hypothetical protein
MQLQSMPQMILIQPQHIYNLNDNTKTTLHHPYVIKQYTDKVNNQMLT